MAFLLGNTGDESYTAHGAVVGLRPLQMTDFSAWAALRSASRNELIPFEPQWSDLELARSAFRVRLRSNQRDRDDGVGFAFGIFHLDGDRLLGGVTLSNVRRGVTQSAETGYWMATQFTRRGLMTDAVKAVVAYGFGHLALHRIEAACLPNNLASMRVLERNGFEREGLARSYLKINGQWADHVLFGLVAEDDAAAESLQFAQPGAVNA